MDINKPSLSKYKSNKTLPNRTSSEARSASELAGSKISSVSSSNVKSAEWKEGQLLKGQIIDHRYNQVSIRLEPGKQLVTAKLSGDVPLSIGQEAQFQVVDEGTDRLVLKYIPTDTSSATDSAIQKALSAAGLPLNDRNKAIVEELLNHRMPIDKQTLQTLVRLSVTNRGISSLTLVLMYKNNIPMTSSNLRQFEAYQNGTHQLLNGLRAISNQLFTILRSENTLSKPALLQSESAAAQNLNSDLTDIEVASLNTKDAFLEADNSSATSIASLNEPLSAALSLNQKLLAILNNTKGHKQSSMTDAPIGELLNKEELQMLSKVIGQSAENLEGSIIDIPGDTQQITNQSQKLSDSSAIKSSDMNSSAVQVISKLLEPFTHTETETPLMEVLSSSERLAITENLGDIPDTEHIKARIFEGNATVKETLEFLQNHLEKSSAATASKLLQSSEYRTLLEVAFMKKWTLTPERLVEKNSVSELYQNLQEDLNQIHTLLHAGIDTQELQQIQEPVKNLQDNLHFMRDLNDLFTYLQLPLQIKDRNIHSDLYVFTRKKVLKDAQDNISVLLHLDMENLGSLNIHIQMKQDNVQAKFFIEDKEAFKLIEHNLPLLEEVLHQKGYHIHTEVEHHYDKPDFGKDFIEQNTSEQFVPRYTFDIRT